MTEERFLIRQAPPKTPESERRDDPSHHPQRRFRLAVAVLTATLSLNAAQTADSSDGFEEYGGAYQGFATLKVVNSLGGRASGALRAKSGPGGVLKISSAFKSTGGKFKVRRKLTFTSRKFRSTTRIALGGGTAKGKGRGRYKFDGRRLRYQEKSVVTATGDVQTIKGTARFRRGTVRIREVWKGEDRFVFTYEMRRKTSASD